MSLINEALKRAQTQRGGTQTANSWSAEQTRPRRRGVRGAIVLVLCLTAAVATVTFLSEPADQTIPKQAGAQLSPDPKGPATQTKPAQPAEPAQEAAQERPGPEDIAHAAKAAAGAPQPTGQGPHLPVVILPAPAPNPATPATPAPEEPPPPTLSAEDFKLGGIMQSDGVGHAIVNGQLVGVGGEIEGARVVSISKSEVLIERDGERLALRM